MGDDTQERRSYAEALAYGESIQPASNNQILHIVKKSLSCIDERLIDHGERVAYIADAIASLSPTLNIDRDHLTSLCLFHDIGAYKTEEINNMVAFETGDVMAHAAYGYAFLRNTTGLGACSEAVLYHHLSYQSLRAVDTPYQTLAALIFLADRADILMSTGDERWLEQITELSGIVFSPELVALLYRAEKELGVSAAIRAGAYTRFISEWEEHISLSREDVTSYLSLLVYSIDFRSPFTVTHTANTVCISLALAERMGLGPEERELIRAGAFLHDIGKIATPYSILENPGKLDAEQMAVMRRHVSDSEAIISGIVSDDVCQIAVRHHEKLNGTGYPHQLTAAELTLPQRIVAAADVLSALISRRSYKEAFPREKALAIIAGMRDAGELCPAVCNVILQHYDEIMDTVQRTNDPVVSLYETIQNDYRTAEETLRRIACEE